MKEADASNFFRRRSRRAVKSQDEINGEFSPSLLVAAWPAVWSVKLFVYVVVCKWSLWASVCFHTEQTHPPLFPQIHFKSHTVCFRHENVLSHSVDHLKFYYYLKCESNVWVLYCEELFDPICSSKPKHFTLFSSKMNQMFIILEKR